MNKIQFILALVLIITTACSSNEEDNNDVTDDNKVTFLKCPNGNHPHLIDLSLPSGTKWACCNVGADKPEASGDFYAWGETETKSSYSFKTYAYWVQEKHQFIDLGNNISGTQYDVAHVKWRNSWQMPTLGQFEELIRGCTYERTSLNGISGFEFTGRNGKAIFIPAAGYWSSSKHIGYNICSYWTSTANQEDPQYAFSISSAFKKIFPIDGKRLDGSCVRPVANGIMHSPPH